MPLLALEIALRLATEPTRDAVDLNPVAAVHDMPPLFQRRDDEQRWVIPPERYNFFRPESFLAEKPPGLQRVFVLGGSTVQGRPFAIETAFATWLQMRLEACQPDRSFEVVNCGGVSYASYRLAKILDEVLAHQPDAIVLYTGHNEFLEERAYREIREMNVLSRWTNRIGDRLRTVRWIRQQFTEPPGRLPDETLPNEVDAKLDHAGGWDSYHRNPAWRQSVEADFENTLRRMIVTAQQAGVPLILCLPTCDLVNTPPFKVETAPDLEPQQRRAFERQWSQARTAEADPKSRIQACHRCLKIDPHHAGAQYLLGSLLYQPQAAGISFDPEQAREHLIAARDRDVCPLRATTQILASTRELAKQYKVPLLDIGKLFDRSSPARVGGPDGIPDPEAFIDHVHPTIGGHQRIGRLLAREFEKLGWIESDAGSEQRYRQAVAAHLDSLDEAYFHRGYQRLEGLQRWASGRLGDLAAPGHAAENESGM